MSSTLADWRQAAAAEMSERELLAIVTSMAGELGYRCYHPFDSRHSEAGYPDLSCVRVNAVFGPPRFLMAECKIERGKLTPAQYTWRDALLAAGVEWYCWRPSALLDGSIFEILRHGSDRSRSTQIADRPASEKTATECGWYSDDIGGALAGMDGVGDE